MVWPFSPAASSTAPRREEIDGASKAIASIFSPSHAALTSSPAPPPPVPNATRTPSSSGSGGGEEAPSTGSGRRAWWPFSQTATPEPLAGGPRAAQEPRQGGPAVADLPPCPVAGYTLDPQRGLVDTLADPPRLLTTPELRQLIVQLSGLEQSAKHDIDSTFASHMGGRSLRAVELLVSPCLFAASIYLMTYKTAQLYSSAVPRRSFLLNHLSRIAASLAPARLRGVATASTSEQRERVAQRHRRLMQATNARVFFTFMTGALLFGVAAVTRPGLDVMENNPEVNLGRQMVGYQQHSEAALKYLWFVYYHHPVYAREATEMLAPAHIAR